MLSKELSLYSYCKNCNLFCCRGTPRVSEREKEKILKKAKKDYFRRETLGYYVTKQEKGFCKYLRGANKCSIQHAKPIDCMIFPIDPVYNEKGEISFVIETGCQAATHLTKKFIKKATGIGKEWIKEFTVEQFNDYWKKYKEKSGKRIVEIGTWQKDLKNQYRGN